MTVRLKGIAAIILILVGHTILAQEDELVSQIKNRYNALDKIIPTAIKTPIENITYFIVDNKIVKANIRTDSLDYEFFYDNELSIESAFFVLTKKRN